MDLDDFAQFAYAVISSARKLGMQHGGLISESDPDELVSGMGEETCVGLHNLFCFFAYG